MITHVLTCPCGKAAPMDGWLHALEQRKLHNRFPGHDATIEVFTSEWAQRLGLEKSA